MASKKDGNHTPTPPIGKLTLKTHDAGVIQRKRKPAKNKFDVEEKVGSDWSYKRKKFIDYRHVIDRPNDRYRKKLVDPDTGEVIMDVDKPLSEHQGHGAAKTPKDD